MNLRRLLELCACARLLVGGSGDAALAGGRPEFAPLPESSPDSSGLWQPFLTLRTAGGYRSNPLYGTVPMGTGFGALGVDLFLLRLPTDATTVTAFFSAEDVRYFTTLRPVTNDAGATQERTLLSSIRIGQGLGAGTNWTLKIEGRHLYYDQYLNTSSFDALTTNLSSLRAVTHLGSLIPALAWDDGGHWHAEVAGVGTRQVFLDSSAETGLSSTWEIGPRLLSSYRSAFVGSLELELTGVHREFDERVQSSSLGLPLADTRLRQDELRTELTWQRKWGAGRHWQTILRTFHVWRRENGEGYTDYDRLGLVATVRYEIGAWSARAAGRWSTYDYPNSYIVFGGVLAVPRKRESQQVETRLAYAVRRNLRIYGEYQWERDQANRASDNYTAHLGTLGLEYDF